MKIEFSSTHKSNFFLWEGDTPKKKTSPGTLTHAVAALQPMSFFWPHHFFYPCYAPETSAGLEQTHEINSLSKWYLM